MVLLLLLGQGSAQEFTVVVGRSDHGLGPGFNHQTKLVSNSALKDHEKSDLDPDQDHLPKSDLRSRSDPDLT